MTDIQRERRKQRVRSGELGAEENRRRVPIQNKRAMATRTAVLRTLYIGDALSIVMVAPKTSALLTHLDGGTRRRTALYKRIDHARARLVHDGLARINKDGDLELSVHGNTYVERMLVREYAIPEQARWDGKWRILMFDVREKRRRVRSQLRRLLQGAGFVLLQDSVWVHPYPCDEFVQILRAHLKSGVGELRQVTADALESDRALREHFHLA